ncbi:MAG: isochorismatase family protein [Chloroflexota bacterium]
MKESYFTPDTIGPKAQDMLHSLDALQRRHAPPFDGRSSALLVLDMQEYFLEPDSHAFVPSALAILPGVRALVQAYAALELPIVFTRHVNTAQDAGLLATWWRDLITAEHPRSALTPHLDSSLGQVIEKTRYDAFLGTELESWLRARQVDQLVITGVMTHLCCETTARSAFMRGWQVFFLVDGTATYNEDFHRATLLNLAHGFANLLLVEQVLSALQEMTG